MPNHAMSRLSLTVAVLLSTAAGAFAVGPEPILLWPDGAPGAVGDTAEDRPLLRVYTAPDGRSTGAGVVVCPGGGYRVLATDHEGHQVAGWLNSIGVSAYVLTYRLGPRYRHPAPLQDAQRAIRYVRAHADSWGVDPQRLGIMGFSAGGHLASTAATHFDDGDAASGDPIARISCRPDFVILGYPVVSLATSVTHGGSRSNLLGDSPDPALVEQLSNEQQVTANSPPAFLFHTGEDSAVPVQNSLAYYEACLRAGVPAELHIYQNGPHGVGLAAGDPVAASWTERLAAWLKTSAFLARVKRAAVDGTVRVDGEPLRWGMITFVPEGENEPTAFAMVSRGKFQVPAQRGAVVGTCRIEVRDLGAVERSPTLEQSGRIDRGKLSCQVGSGSNTLVVEVNGD